MAAGLNEQLQGGRELNYITQRDNYAGSLFSRVIDAINTGFKNAGVSAVGKLSPPPPIASINVQGTQSGSTITCPSEILHFTLNHPGAIQKNIRYFSELDTTPAFLSPHVIDHGTSRTGLITLPTFSSADNKTNSAPTTYYLRSYSQMPGSDRSEIHVHGGLGSPIGIQMGGTSVTALLPSTGSGTASPTGQQGGQGLGVVLNRPAPRPKRSTL